MAKRDDDEPDDTDDDAQPSRGGDVEGRLDRIERAVARLVDAVGGSDDTDDDGPGDDTDTDAGATSEPRTHAAIEADVEAQVERAMKRVGREADIDARLGAVETKVAEKPPVKLRRLTRALWGGGDA